MRISIIAVDNIVSVDREAHSVACDELTAQDIHAVQWHDDHGEIEFQTFRLASEKRWDRKPNEMIEDFSEYEIYVERWRESKQKDDEERKRIAALLRYTWPVSEPNITK
jgi:hypothetical protein